MSDQPDMYVTGELCRDELEAALRAVPKFLQDWYGDGLVKVYYGYGSGLHPQLWYAPMEVRPSRLSKFIEDSVRQEIFRPGESDLMIEVPGFALTFCHEGDVHTGGADLEAQKALWAASPFSAFPLLRSPA